MSDAKREKQEVVRPRELWAMHARCISTHGADGEVGRRAIRDGDEGRRSRSG